MRRFESTARPTNGFAVERLASSSGKNAALIKPSRMVSMIKDTVKNADRELTIDLLNFISEEFPSCTEKHRDVLIGAASAGASVFTMKKPSNKRQVRNWASSHEGFTSNKANWRFVLDPRQRARIIRP